MPPKGRRTVLLALLVLACAALGIEEAAGAGGAALLYTPLHGFSVPDAADNGDGVTTRFISCPSGHPNPTGGGAVIVGDQSKLDLELKTSGPAVSVGPNAQPPSPGNPGDWGFELNNSSGSRAQGTIFVICAKGDFVYPTKHAQIAPGDEGERIATCPKHTKLAGGGVFAVPGDHKTEIGSSAPEGHTAHPDAWDGTVNNGSAESVFLTVRAACAKHGTYTVVHSHRHPLPNGSQAAATAICPKGSHVSGGGVQITGLNDGLEVASSTGFDNGDGNPVADDGWTGVANNDSSGSLEHMQTFAVCKT